MKIRVGMIIPKERLRVSHRPMNCGAITLKFRQANPRLRHTMIIGIVKALLIASVPALLSVSNAAESDMRIKEIKNAIQQLPEIFKTPFLLYFDGYKYHEIADVLNEPLGTIKSRIHFARKLLKEQISRF